MDTNVFINKEQLNKDQKSLDFIYPIWYNIYKVKRF